MYDNTDIRVKENIEPKVRTGTKNLEKENKKPELKEQNNVIVNESFDDEDEDLFEKLDKKQFESQELLDLKLDSEEISHENEIERLISFEEISKNLKYSLEFQPQGALRILRDMNGTALLSDEVGLGKTITTGIVVKECIKRGFVKNILVLTPPSLVNQWKEELEEKFNIDFNVVENENEWGKPGFNRTIASLDRVKIYQKDKG